MPFHISQRVSDQYKNNKNGVLEHQINLQKKIHLQTERFLMLPVELQHHHLQKYHLR